MAGTRFRTMLAPVGEPTGDGRRFKPGGITLAPTPFPFEWARERDIGHDGAVVIGAVETAEVRDDGVWGEGVFFDDVDREEMPRLAEDVAEALMLIDQGVLGPSVDLDSFVAVPVREGTDEEITEEDWDDPDLRVELLVTEGRVRAATLVSVPAFVETPREIELVPPEQEPTTSAALVAAVTGSTGLPIAGTDLAWDGAGAANRVFEAATNDDGEVDTAAVSKAFLWRDPDADAQTKAAYKLGFADMIDGTLTIVPRGVAAVAGGRGVGAADIPEDDKAAIRGKVCQMYARIQAQDEDWPDCPFDRDEESLVRSLTASVTLPDVSAFDIPEADELTPITFDFDRGVAFGHIAAWNTCHTGFSDVCVVPPRNPRDDGEYVHFNRHPVDTSGGLVWAGRLTVGGRHPGLTLTASQAMSAYDGMATAAYVRARDGKLGLWVSGLLNQDLDERHRAVLARRKVSGDWRETPDGLSLVELLALSPGPRLHSEPGFPVAVGTRDGRQVALTASLGPSVDTPTRRDSYAKITQAVTEALRTERARERERQNLARALQAVLGPVADRARTDLAAALGVELDQQEVVDDGVPV